MKVGGSWRHVGFLFLSYITESIVAATYGPRMTKSAVLVSQSSIYF